jgi:Holliday junction DNA helicase RuvA
MIASLHGRLESLGSDWAVINVNGIGFQVYMPTSTLSTLGRIGKELHLYTCLVLREDSVTLYGFKTTEELDFFQTLISVSGFGRRIALAVLSTMSVEQASMAIATSNTDLLTTVPGIGKKMAGRLIMELKDKIGAGFIVTPTNQLAGENAEVISALISLGYSVAEASQALATIPSTDLSLEEKVKLALQYFASK